MKRFYYLMLLTSCLYLIFNPCSLPAKKQKEQKEKDPSEDVIYKHYGTPEELREAIIEDLKKGYPELFKSEVVRKAEIQTEIQTKINNTDFNSKIDDRVNPKLDKCYAFYDCKADVKKEHPIPFKGDLVNKIENKDGFIKFTQKGKYIVTINTNSGCTFELQHSKADKNLIKEYILPFTSSTLLIDGHSDETLRVILRNIDSTFSPTHTNVHVFMSIHEI